MLNAALALAMLVPLEDEMLWADRSAKIPIEYNPVKKGQIRQLALYLSADRGKTWARHAVAQPGQTRFRFTAGKDGPYWMVLVIENSQGVREPADLKKAEPRLKMFVRTAEKGK